MSKYFIPVLCLFFLMASPLSRAAQLAPKDTGNKAQTLHLTDREGLALGARLVESGKLAEAKALYATLAQSTALEIQLEAVFQLAQVLVLEKKFSEAISLLLSILNRHPSLPRVRLELARAYFMDQNYSEAEFHFTMVRGGRDLPPEVTEKIDMFLTAIRKQKDWTVAVGFNLIPDSNINQASGGTQQCIDTPYGLLCRKMEDTKSGMGASFDATADYYLRFTKEFGLRSTVGLYILDYESKEHDDNIVYAASGPRYTFDSGEVSLQPTFNKRWVAGKQYSESYGLRFDGQKHFGRLIIAAGGSWAKNRYNDPYVHSVLQGEDYSAYITPRYILTSQSYIQPSISFTQSNARMDALGYDSWRYGLGWYYFFKYGFSLKLDYALAKEKYHADQYYITQRYTIDPIRRADTLQTFGATISTNIFEDIGLRPSIQYTYNKRDSNIWSNSYDRQRINVGFEFVF